MFMISRRLEESSVLSEASVKCLAFCKVLCTVTKEQFYRLFEQPAYRITSFVAGKGKPS